MVYTDLLNVLNIGIHVRFCILWRHT